MIYPPLMIYSSNDDSCHVRSCDVKNPASYRYTLWFMGDTCWICNTIGMP